MSSCAALPIWKTASANWNPDLADQAAQLLAAAQDVDPAEFGTAVGAAAEHRLERFLTGLKTYRDHPYNRSAPDVPVAWSEGESLLLDYGNAVGHKAGDDAIPVLVVPSLVNRGYVLDITHQRSLMRFLAGQGLRAYLLEWGAPGAEERRFTLTDYISGRLDAVFSHVREANGGRPVVLAGYCMGGLLTLALALQRAADIAGLVLLATPWDFHAERGELARALAAAMGMAQPVFDSLGEMPVDALQTIFAGLDPGLALRKFTHFADLDPTSDAASHFVALEDWLNDGIALAAPVARECLSGWYGENTTAQGLWRVAGKPVLPEAVSVPTLAIIPHQDRLVPPGSAMALAEAIPEAACLRPKAGHIGMVTGSRAEDQVWRPLADWIGALDTV